MSGIQPIIDLIIYVSVLSLGTFVVIQFLRNAKKRALFAEINKIESKLAALRLNLKARIKRKVLHYRGSYPAAISSGDPVDTTLMQLTEINFDKNTDFQHYIELCRKMHDFIKMAAVEPSQESAELAQKTSFMGTDFKNELSIVRTINDMVMVSKVLYKLMVRYNNFERKARMVIKEPIQFPSLFEIQSVYNSEENQNLGDLENENSNHTTHQVA